MELIIYFQEMWQLAIKGQAQGVFFWFAFYMFIICFYSLILQIRTRYWSFVQGELVEFGFDRFGASIRKSDQNYWANALYNYSVSDVDYRGTRISPWHIIVSHNLRFILEKQMSYVQRSSVGTVKVFYNPNNPKKSYLIIAGKIGIGITLLMIVLPLTLFYYKYHA